MPKIERNKKRPDILYSCYANTSREGEQFIEDHVFSYIITGNTDMFVNGKTYTFSTGDYRFLAKNQLAKFTKHASKYKQFKTISIRIDKATLISISEEYHVKSGNAYTGDSIVLLTPNDLFTNFINSLAPYMDGSHYDNPIFTQLKVKEAVMILLQTNPQLQQLLFDFSEPGKIDLAAYMNQNYKFNVDIRRFAYLTGRSLATFKRDFEKVFGTSPNRWLQQKRLNDAYYLIKEKGKRVSDVYMDVGFKDFSHFSYAFKKAFGISPSALSIK